MFIPYCITGILIFRWCFPVAPVGSQTFTPLDSRPAVLEHLSGSGSNNQSPETGLAITHRKSAQQRNCNAAGD